MSRSGVNLAVTKDGGTYNKLRRPDDFLAALTAPPSSKEEPVSATSTADSNKRKLEEAEISDLQDDGEPESKRPKDVHIPNASFTLAKPLAADPRRIRRPVRDCGMQSMFPELDEGSSDEAIDEVTKEALAYLRSVRSEASTIPKLLVATPEIPEDKPDRSIYNNGRGDYRIVYYDGTWVAVNLHSMRLPRDCRLKDADDLDPQKQYYSSLLRRYEVLRETLASTNSRGLATLVEANPSKYTDMKLPSSRKAWLRTFDQGFPTPARVAHISEYNLFCALESCAETLDRCQTISRQKSCWIWTLLALAGEKGTLDYYRIGRIRDLGHKAGQLSVCLRSGVWQSPPSEDEDKEVEDWDVDGEGIDGEEKEEEEEEEEDEAGSDSHTVENENFGELPTKAEERHQDEEGEVNEQPNGTQSDAPFIPQNGADSIAAQVDGADEREANMLPRAQKKNDSSDDSADMSMSEDEGVVRKDNKIEVEDEATNVEEARARLLAQLGDRLIQPSVPPPKGPRQGFHARDYNGKICKDSNCRVADRQCQEGHHRAASKADQERESPGLRPAAPPAQVYASRAEAEMQRQRMRQEELAKIKMNGSLMYGDTPATLPCEADGVIQASKPLEGLLQTQMNTSGGAEDAPELCKQLDIAETVTKAEKVEDSEAGKQQTDPVDLNTRVTIDMVLTVVAEYYGQKDLLRFREVW